jgi:hypothetical protein
MLPGPAFRIALVTAIVAALGCGRSASDNRAVQLVTGCGIEFERAEGWELDGQPVDSAGRCVIRLDLTDRALRDSSQILGQYAVRIETIRTTFDSLTSFAGFAKRDSGWVVLGRHETESAAIPLTRAGLRGVQGIASIGCSKKSDSTYAGLCDSPRAVLVQGDLGVFIDAGPGAEGAFNRVVATVALRKP